MGLDIYFGFPTAANIEESDDFRISPYLFLLEILKENGLELPVQNEIYDFFNKDPFKSGVFSMGYYFKEKKLPFEQITKLTTSCYQFIVPLDFEKPISVFKEKTPLDYKTERDDYADRPYCEWFKIDSSRYPGHYDTPFKDIYLLSSYQLVKESSAYLDQNAPP